MALEAQRELEFQRGFTGKVEVGTWMGAISAICVLQKIFIDSFGTLLATQSAVLYLVAHIKQSGQHFQVKMDNTMALRMMNLGQCTCIFFLIKKIIIILIY
ncbi:hypothetical protein P5673_016410 [Acropora cervicornis]|uniref:Uncharacterized protein n=1 Tax=Acropora cervicornis TaxID=6130 RepID=A0AAD9QG35_ACRCE|nr:hypothetical protein P5673_016410 [Acropora cervicornis]